MDNPQFVSATPWAPHPKAAPVTRQADGQRFVTAANGSRTCAGGWSFQFGGTAPGGALDFGGSREARPYRRGALGRSCPPRPSACRTGAVPRFNGKT
jgi:hypothetical protein